MKSSTAAVILAFSAAALAVPAKRQSSCLLNTVINPSATDAENSINQWFQDVTTVNAFLNVAASLSASDLQATASAVLVSASDEPCQLATLTNNPDFAGGLTQAFDCAVDDLKSVFQTHVLDNLNTIIANPSDTATVDSAVNDINTFRCCNVLPDVDLIWLDSADDNGISNVVPITAPREDACASIDCSTVSTAAQCMSLPN